MIIHYKCKCDPLGRDLSVPDRISSFDMLAYMECIAHYIGYDHRKRSPNCKSAQMEYAKIPIHEMK
jgi:hypothetical protein